MQINWKNNAKEPYLFRQQAQWNGIRVHRASVLPGNVLEHTALFHEINIPISGHLTTKKMSASGKLIVTKGGAGNICLTPAGQPISAIWEKPLDNMGMLLEPEFVIKTAIENRFNSNFEFAEIYQEKDPLIQHIGFALLVDSNPETSTGRLYADSLIQTLTLHLLKNYSTAMRFKNI